MNSKMKMKLIVIGWLACVVLGTMPCQAQDVGFPDVPKDHWAYQAVTELKQRGILRGYPTEAATKPTPSAAHHRKKFTAQRHSTVRLRH
jgi:hypothetical protein